MQEIMQLKKDAGKSANNICIFCKIVKGEIPAAKIFEDDKTISFLDIAPANKGHALIVTKKHYESLLEIPDEELNNLIPIAKKIARAMSSALGLGGFNILLNNNKVAGQIVPHVHLHIIPRFENDNLKLNWQPKHYKDKEIDEYKEKVKKFID